MRKFSAIGVAILSLCLASCATTPQPVAVAAPPPPVKAVSSPPPPVAVAASPPPVSIEKFPQHECDAIPSLCADAPPTFVRHKKAASPTKKRGLQSQDKLINTSSKSEEENREPNRLEGYSVTASATKQLRLHDTPGELLVWIGISSKAPKIQPGKVTATVELEGVGQTAKVKPFVLGDMLVDPPESICEKIDPTGSEIRFKIFPQKEGPIEVGADVALYTSKDCTGPATQKTAKSVSVTVTVDRYIEIRTGVNTLLDDAWNEFRSFWDKLLILFFALLLFLIRKKLFKWFEFTDKTN